MSMVVLYSLLLILALDHFGIGRIQQDDIDTAINSRSAFIFRDYSKMCLLFFLSYSKIYMQNSSTWEHLG